MNFLQNCSILKGIATLNNRILIAIMNDGLAENRQQHSIILVWDDGLWSILESEPILPWLVAGISSITEKSKSLEVIVGWGGQVLVVDANNCYREGIFRKDENRVSIVRNVAAVDGVFYAAGMRRQMYQRVEQGDWQEIDYEVLYRGEKIEVGFDAVCGFSSDEIYAVGSNGEIWLLENHQWKRMESPTNVHFHSLCCASDGNVYIAGRSGTIVRGRRNSWEVIDTGFVDTIWDVCFFNQKLFFISRQGLFQIENGRVEKIKNNILEYNDFLNFSYSEDCLFVFGRKKIIKFNGVDWQEIETNYLDERVSNTSVASFFDNSVLLIGSKYLGE